MLSRSVANILCKASQVVFNGDIYTKDLAACSFMIIVMQSLSKTHLIRLHFCMETAEKPPFDNTRWIKVLHTCYIVVTLVLHMFLIGVV